VPWLDIYLSQGFFLLMSQRSAMLFPAFLLVSVFFLRPSLPENTETFSFLTQY